MGAEIRFAAIVFEGSANAAVAIAHVMAMSSKQRRQSRIVKFLFGTEFMQPSVHNAMRHCLPARENCL